MLFWYSKILPNVNVFTTFSGRICYIRIAKMIFGVIIKNYYTSKENKSKDIKDKFYGELASVYNKLGLHSKNLIVSYVNAKFEKEQIYRPVIGLDNMHEVINKNGTRLINFACSINVTNFPQNNIHEYKYI